MTASTVVLIRHWNVLYIRVFSPGGAKAKTEAEVKAYMKEVAARATACKTYKGTTRVNLVNVALHSSGNSSVLLLAAVATVD